ncbi:MAG: sensor histidine kinase [Dermatophilaceae bacterium]
MFVRATALDRVAGWFDADEEWERPRPPVGRSDIVIAVAFAAVGLFLLELVRSVGTLDDVPFPWWVHWIATATGAALLVGRRRWPLTVGTLAATHMLVVGVTMQVIMGQFTLQVVYFFAVMSAVAWASDRRWMTVVVAVIVLVMFVWLALQFLVGSVVQDVLDQAGDGERHGVIGPVPAAVLLTVVINIIYFGGAVLAGRASWRSARQTALLTDQAATITEQGDLLRARAVTEERVRIARELHDVVAHHVSVIGIQAAAARRVMDTDPAAAGTALGGIERSSREAVHSMRGLLGTLRDVGRDQPDGADAPDRAPQPGVRDLPSVVNAAQTPSRRVEFEVVESPVGAAERLPAAMAHTMYRTVQEALANVERHSTATRVSVVVRATEGARGFAEVEVVDDGRPRAASSGSGLGQLGIRERVASHRGAAEIGPRRTGGYRVRVRLPWISTPRRASSEPSAGPGRFAARPTGPGSGQRNESSSNTVPTEAETASAEVNMPPAEVNMPPAEANTVSTEAPVSR